jgi:acetylornithine deacetylase/succinyl-diaminopimelate desuccinylase-like protein
MMRDSGIKTEIIEEHEGNPVLLGSIASNKSTKTLLLYTHYDVQPPEPLEEWKSDPFGAELRDGKIVARGAADSKNNVIAIVKMAEAYLKTVGELPINLKFLIEGEEEIGSVHLPQFVDDNRSKLKADANVCYDGDLDDHGRPIVGLGVKGFLYVELRATGPKVDLHSSLAPLSPNAAWRLIWALDTIKSSDEKIKIDDWYDRAHQPTSAELQVMQTILLDENKQKSEMGLSSLLLGRKGLEALRAFLYDPTCTVCGFLTGYTGDGAKTVLPSKAMAKLDFRIVYDQRPDELLEKLKLHLNKHGFEDIEVVKIGSFDPSKTPMEAPIARAAIAAGKEVFKDGAAVYPTLWASGPDSIFTKRLGLNSIWLGCGSPFANAHAPNEFEAVDDLLRGIEYAGTVVEKFDQV